jgi:putative tryptophan/tyrosine transport system substrate-binding protein
VTGLSNQSSDLVGKRLELLREVVPGLSRLAIMANGDNPLAVLELGDAQAEARKLGLDATTWKVRGADDIAPIIEMLNGHAEALYVGAGKGPGSLPHRRSDLPFQYTLG